jgi:hypothetical protein
MAFEPQGLPASMTFTILVVADLNLIDGGGLHDPGVVSYPILIVLGSLLFGKRSAPFFAVGTIGSLVLIAGLEMNGVIQTDYATDPDDVVTISVHLIATTILIWVIMDNTEKNLNRIKRSEAELREAYDHTPRRVGKGIRNAR